MAPYLKLEHDVILFDQGCSKVSRAEEVDKINGAADFLNLLGFDSIAVIKGHASAEGRAIDDQDISDERAKTVRDLLVAHGVSRVVLTSFGVGSNEPAVAETARTAKELEKQRLQNRRVEIIITSNPITMRQPQRPNTNIWKPVQKLLQPGPMGLYREQLPPRLRKPPQPRTKEFKEYKKDLDDWLKENHIDPKAFIGGVLGKFGSYQDAPDDDAPGAGGDDD